MAQAIRWAAILLAGLPAAAVRAEPLPDPAPAAESAAPPPPILPSFTFKRISAPKSGTKKRITVQIDPAEQAARLAEPFLPLPDKPIPKGSADPALLPLPMDIGVPVGSYAWFWEKVSPKIDEGAGRFSLALANLSGGPDGVSVNAPRLQALQSIAQAHGAEILMATIDKRVSPALVLAVISVESAGHADAVSSAGARGLMQLIPATADRFGVGDATDPAQNIRGGVAYLDWLMTEFNNDPLMAIAAYNSGENAVKGAGGVPPFPETRDYVPKVLAAWAVARGLCVTPPELVTDGCVFAVKG